MNSAASSPRILLIEDEMLVAGMLKGMLSSLGYAVAGATGDLGEAMEILDREAVDAVVLDINLNGKMSYPVADELTQRGIPFIFSTGYEQFGLPAKYEGYPLLRKPFRRSALGNALANLLKRDPERPGWARADEDAGGLPRSHDEGSSPLSGNGRAVRV